MFYSTCGTCGDTLEVTFTGQDHHPTCKPSEIFQLTNDWCDAAQRDDIAEAERLQAAIDAHDRVPALGASALWYATVAGWPVFPLRPGEKTPATKNGFKDATTDPDQIREWWTANRDYNIGAPSGLAWDVVDVDGPIGIQSLIELGEETLGDVHAKAATPRGFHFFIAASGNGNRVGVRPGIDYRGRGGFCVLPSSQMDGRRWMWLIPPSPAIMGSMNLTMGANK